jgi:hypothetical protein
LREYIGNALLNIRTVDCPVVLVPHGHHRPGPRPRPPSEKEIAIAQTLFERFAANADDVFTAVMRDRFMNVDPEAVALVGLVFKNRKLPPFDFGKFFAEMLLGAKTLPFEFIAVERAGKGGRLDVRRRKAHDFYRDVKIHMAATVRRNLEAEGWHPEQAIDATALFVSDPGRFDEVIELVHSGVDQKRAIDSFTKDKGLTIAERAFVQKFCRA